MPTSTRGRDPAVEEEFLGALYKGGELLASGKIVEAREHLERAHGLSPKNEKAQNLLGLAYFKLGLYEQAAEVYEKLVDDNPVDATLRVNLGLVFLKTNNLERCIKEFETATDLEPTHKKAHNYLGLALAQQGDYVKAREHFELSGSDMMADKMARAIAAQSAPSGFTPAAPKAAQTVVIGEPPISAPTAPSLDAAPPPAPLPQDEDAIEVMSDEELPSDVYVMPEEINVAGTDSVQETPSASNNIDDDWGAQLGAEAAREAPLSTDEMRFAEDEGPSEEQLLVPPPRPSAPVEELPMVEGELAAELEPAPVVNPSEAPPAWLTMEAAEAQRAAEEVPEGDWAEARAPRVPIQEDANWVQEPSIDDAPLTEMPPVAMEEAPVVDEAQFQAAHEGSFSSEQSGGWATDQIEGVYPTPLPQPMPLMDPVEPESVPVPLQEMALEPLPQQTQWATEPLVSATSVEAQWEAVTPPEEVPAPIEEAPVAPAENWTTPNEAEDQSWAGVAEAQPEEAPAPNEEAPISDQDTWNEAPPEEWTSSPTQIHAAPAEEEQPAWSEPPAEEAPPVQEQQWNEPLPPEEVTWQPPAGPPAGYSAMQSQQLGELGASGAWVQDTSSGPFHLSTDGLAVTVAGEMLARLEGLVAITGSVEVTPELKRRRGRSSTETFGIDSQQLQRLKGNGVVYLETGKARFHAVDLTDQNGVSIDDDGAYFREELVFAFEEPIFFENGKLSAEGQQLDLVHLKGTGRVLLQLDGTLRAMPIPTGAPLVVPLQRLVGWFGRVTPRLKGLGGRGALELTGEGYALLGTPVERS